MERLLIEVESSARAKELMSLLSAVNFVKKVSIVKDTSAKDAVMKHIEEGLKEGKRILNGQAKGLTHAEFKAAIKE